MSESANIYTARAAELRRAFDRSFAEPRTTGQTEQESVLVFRVAGDRFATRLSEIGGIAKSPGIVAVPNKTHALLGLANIRGGLIPVYSLSELLGYQSKEDVRWLLLCGESARLGLGVSEVLGSFKVEKSAFTPTERSSTAEPQSRKLVVINSIAHNAISISPLIQAIKNPNEGK